MIQLELKEEEWFEAKVDTGRIDEDGKSVTNTVTWPSVSGAKTGGLTFTTLYNKHDPLLIKIYLNFTIECLNNNNTKKGHKLKTRHIDTRLRENDAWTQYWSTRK